MRRRLLRFLLYTVFLSFVSINTLSADSALSTSIGTTGFGIEWISAVSHKLRARLVVSTIGFDSDLDEDGIDYEVEFNSTNLGAILDWHPMAGGFRLSGGLLSSSLGIDLNSVADQQNYQIGKRLYQGDLELSGELNFADVAPYFAMGWAKNLSESGFYYSAEIGALLIGEPRLSLSATGTATSSGLNGGNPIEIGSDPTFQTDLESERQNLLDELSDFSVFPVVNFGIGFRY